jgi:putative modified peptide
MIVTDVAKLKLLFDKLGSDDAFRARLEADPVSALAELGVHVPSGLPLGKVTLPSKEEVQANAPNWLSHVENTPTTMAMFFFLK